jgi:hypothetical protein
MELIGFKKESFPKLVIVKPYPGGIKKYMYSGKIADMDSGSLRNFLNQFWAGKVPPLYKSEAPVHPNNQPLPLRQIVGSEFKSEVLETQTSEEVLLAVIVDWCQFCPTIKETLFQVANERVPGLKVAFMNGDFNEAYGLQVVGYPSLYLYNSKLRGKEPLEYVGDWSHQDVTIFLAKNS